MIFASYSLPRKSPVRLEVLDSRGAPVTALVDAVQRPGFHSVEWSARDTAGKKVASGVYLIHMKAGGFSHSVRAVID